MALVKLRSTRDLFRILFAWKWHSLAAFVVFGVFLMGFAYIYTPDYEITAKVMILPKSNEELVISARDSKDSVYPVSTQDVNTEWELLMSQEVIRETVRSFAETGGNRGLGLKKMDDSWIDRIVDQIKYYINEAMIALKLKTRLSPFEANVVLLTESLEVEPIAGSNILLVTLTAEMPKVGKVVLDRLLETYVSHHNKSFTREGEVNFLGRERDQYYARLVKHESDLKEYQKKYGLVSVNRQIESNIALLAEFASDLKRIDLSIGAQENRIALMKKSLEGDKGEFVIGKEMRTIPKVLELERSITPLLVTRSELSKTLTPLSKEIRDMDLQIDAFEEGIRKEVFKAVKADEMELATLKMQRKLLDAQIDKLKEDTESLNQLERKVNDMAREAQISETNYKLYAAKTEESRIYREQRNQEFANVRIADKPFVPAKWAFPNRIIFLIVTVFIGFFAALGTPFLLEYIDHRIKTSSEAEEVLSLPVICYFCEDAA